MGTISTQVNALYIDVGLVQCISPIFSASHVQHLKFELRPHHV